MIRALSYFKKAGYKCGLLVRKESLWIGVHYAPYNKRFCINLIPCVTVWITKPGGVVPHVQEGSQP